MRHINYNQWALVLRLFLSFKAALVTKHSPTTAPLPPMLCDIPVNVRQHLDPPIGDQYCGFYITEVQTNSEYKTDEARQTQVTTKAELAESTRLWDLARYRLNTFYFASN